MGSTAQFDNIFQGLLSTPGKLRIAQSGLGWKSSDENESVTTIAAADLRNIQWIRVARNFQLRISTTKNKVTFDGFKREEFERLQNLCKQYYNITIESKDTSVRGWNWGIAEVQSQDLAFLVAGKQAFTLPLSSVSNTSITKTEVALEFSSLLPPPPDAANEDALAKKKRLRMQPDELSEMRLYLPGSAKGMKKKHAKVKAAEGVDGAAPVEESDDSSDDDESGEEGEEGETAAQVFHDAIKEKADIGLVVGESFCTIPEVLCTTPRGRFDIDMHAEFLRLKGKTYDYRIAYSQIQKLFLLPKPDEIHCQFVVNIDPPIRQGQTRYPYLVMQFVKEELMELDLNLDEDTIKSKYDGVLKARYDDPAFEVVSILFRVLSGKKVTTPGNFQSHDGHSAVKCNLKANEGLLYLLEKQILFISKTPTVILHSDISAVIFARVGGALPSARTFDLQIKTKGDPEHPVVFSALIKEELQSIEEFLRMKKVRVRNEMEELQAEINAAVGVDSDDDDAMQVDKAPEGLLNEDDDEDSEVDEDFEAEDTDSGGSGGSDSEGDDSDAQMSDASADEDAPKKKKQKTD